MSIRTNFALALVMLLPLTGHASPPPAFKQWSPPPKALPIHDGHGGGAKATGIINSVDAVHRTVNFSHEAIPGLAGRP